MMNNIKLIEEAIEHWKRNVIRAENGDKLNMSSLDCPLCEVYIHDGCINCPIMIETGRNDCQGTPYEYIYSGIGANKKLISEEEVSFLKMILRKEKRRI